MPRIRRENIEISERLLQEIKRQGDSFLPIQHKNGFEVGKIYKLPDNLGTYYKGRLVCFVELGSTLSWVVGVLKLFNGASGRYTGHVVVDIGDMP